jgi:hypothetical protein
MRVPERTDGSLRLDVVTRELGIVRAKGLVRVHDVDVPAVARCVAAVTGRAELELEAHHYEISLTRAIDEMGDGDAAEMAAVLFGIAPHVRGLHPIELRKRAAEATYDRPAEASTVDAFRKTREPRILAALAGALLKTTSEVVAAVDESESLRTMASGRGLAVTCSDWRGRELPVLTVGGDPPGRIRELSWAEFGAGIEQIRGQIRDYGTSLDIDLAIGINEGGLLMATLLASASFGRCGIAYVRTVRHGARTAVDPGHVALGQRLAAANAVMLCDFEVKTTPVLALVTRYLIDEGLRPDASLYFAVMGALATAGPVLPEGDHYDVRELPCEAALRAAPLSDVFVGYLMPRPGIDPPLGLR